LNMDEFLHKDTFLHKDEFLSQRRFSLTTDGSGFSRLNMPDS